MKKFIAFTVTLTLLTPALAMAREDEVEVHSSTKVETHGGIKAEVRADSNSGPGSFNSGSGRLLPSLKNIASSTRAEFKGGASSTMEMVKARVEAIKGLIDKKREDMKSRADDARGKAKERFGERVEHLVGQVSNRLASTSNNLDVIAGRIDTRIDTLQDEGHDMDGSIALLATARADLSLANDRILAVNVALEAAMSTTTPKGQIPAVRAAVKAAEDALKLVKDDLIKTLRSVKAEAGETTTVSH